MKILVITRLITPYRMAWFEKLGEKNNLTVLYTRNNYPEIEQLGFIDKPTNLKLIKIKSLKIFSKEISFQIIKYLRNDNQIILFDGYAPLTNMLGIIYLITRKKSYYINVDGLLKSNKNKYFKHILKRIILSKANIFCGSQYTKDQLISLGINDQRCHVHNFTSLINEDILKQPPNIEQKKEIRSILGIHYKKMILSVGQLIHRKGYDVLLKSLKNIDKDIGVYIVGGRPSIKLRKLKQKHNLNNVHFIDFVNNQILIQYYMAADFFVLPTREDIWGLVINEAMACALPIITTNRCGAGIELVKDGVNGYIVASEDIKMFQQKIYELIDNKQLIQKMAIESLNRIKDYTIENMVKINNKVFNNYR
jgi:glycosyltransferase involved in cell wall biosynthesis